MTPTDSPPTATKRRTSAKKTKPREMPSDVPWWDTVPAPPESAPWERWPGVSLRLVAEWNADAVWTSPHARDDKTNDLVPLRGRWELGEWYFDAPSADYACEFFPRYMRHSIGAFAGQPFHLLPWQAALLVRPLFGWKRKSDGLRRFRLCFLEVGKKNGKTQLMSGLAMLLAFADQEPGAQVYAAAASDTQAHILWDESAKSTKACPEFLEDAGIEVFKSSIVQESTDSSFRVISSTIGTKHGFNVHGLVIDEFHTQRSRHLYDTLFKGTSARRQPLVILITTAGDDRASICYEEYERAGRVRDGIIDAPEFLPVLFEMRKDDDWTDEAAWHRANPSLGITKFLEYMRSECAAAKSEPRKRNSFLRLELNVWTESHTVWITDESWQACRRVEPTTDLPSLVACAGVDLSSRVDLTAIVVAFRRPDPRPAETVVVDAEKQVNLNLDYAVEIVPYFFMPREAMLERARLDRIDYPTWAREGWLRVTNGNVTDLNAVAHVLLNEIKPKFPKLVGVGYDPWGALDFAPTLLAKGVPMVEVRQGYGSLSAPSKLLEALVVSRRLTHNGNPLMRWNVSNTEVETDPAGNIKPVKPGGDAKANKRIDGVVATVTALSRLMVATDVSKPTARVGFIRL